MSILDSNNLLNIKSRLGISIATTNSTSVYLASRKLERKLKALLKPFFNYEMDLNIYVDKILDKINNVPLCDAISKHADSVCPKTFYKESKKFKSFMLRMKAISEKPVKEKIKDDDDIVLDDEHLNYI